MVVFARNGLAPQRCPPQMRVARAGAKGPCAGHASPERRSSDSGRTAWHPAGPAGHRAVL